MSDKNKFNVDETENDSALTSSDLKYILDVNKKAIEIYIEVDKQNEKILETFDNFKEIYDNIEEELLSIKNNNLNLNYILQNYKQFQDRLEKILNDNEKNVEQIKQQQVSIKASIESTLKDIYENTDKAILDSSKISSQIDDIDKNLFRLVVILGSTGVGALIAFLTSIFLKK